MAESRPFTLRYIALILPVAPLSSGQLYSCEHEVDRVTYKKKPELSGASFNYVWDKGTNKWLFSLYECVFFKRRYVEDYIKILSIWIKLTLRLLMIEMLIYSKTDRIPTFINASYKIHVSKWGWLQKHNSTSQRH